MKLEHKITALQNQIAAFSEGSTIPFSDFKDTHCGMVKFYCVQDAKASGLLTEFGKYAPLIGVISSPNDIKHEISSAEKIIQFSKQIRGIIPSGIDCSVEMSALGEYAHMSEDDILLKKSLYEGILAGIMTVAKKSEDKRMGSICNSNGRDRIKKLLFPTKVDFDSYNCALISNSLRYYKAALETLNGLNSPGYVDLNSDDRLAGIISKFKSKMPSRNVAHELFEAQLAYVKSESERLYG